MCPAHLTDAILGGLVQRHLRAEQVADALRHLDVCSDCRALASVHLAEIESFRFEMCGDEVEHLDVDEQLIPYVDGIARPDQIEIVETHVEDCAMCRAELDDLRSSRRS